jgi:deoxyribonuclease V
MDLPVALHPWSLSPREAIALQKRLAERVRVIPIAKRVRLVCGADMAFDRTGRTCVAGVVVWDVHEQSVVETALARRKVSFPYVPGLLSFREAPAVLAAIAELGTSPDVFMFDGQGFAHPRRIGLASHVGLWLNRPSLGCAKSRLCGEHTEPAEKRGSRRALRDGGERIGTVLRTRDAVKPVYVSIGHRITLEQAERLVLRCGGGYRLPEPTRLAHQLVTRSRRP